MGWKLSNHHWEEGSVSRMHLVRKAVLDPFAVRNDFRKMGFARRGNKSLLTDVTGLRGSRTPFICCARIPVQDTEGKKMEPLIPFKEAMAQAWKEYRAAKENVMTSMSNGCAYGDLWRLKQLRLNDAIDKVGRLPRAYFGE